MKQHNRRLDLVLALALVAFLILPCYSIEQGFFRFSWLEGFFSQAENGPGILQIFAYGRPWLAVVAVLMLICGFARFAMTPEKRTSVLIGASLLGAGFLALQGLAIGFTGWNRMVSETLFGQLADGQPAFGAGAVLTGLCFLLIFSFGLAERGVMKGDAFVVSSITLLVALVSVFVFYPIFSMFAGSVQDFDGSFKPDGFIGNIQDSSIWSLACVIGDGRCGVAWRTLWLALMTATGSTVLGLSFALVATRTGFPFKKGLRILTVLPIITPPFVIRDRSGADIAAWSRWCCDRTDFQSLRR